jgi:hypothetical protein
VRCLVILALATVSSLARADISGQIAVGAGTEAETTSFATASGSLAGELSRPSAPLEHRGLGGIDDDGNGLWLWTGTDPDDRDGLRVDASATTLARTVIGSGRAAARAYGW